MSSFPAKDDGVRPSRNRANRAADGFLWSISGSIGEVLFRLLSMVLLSRLLSPAEVGTAVAAVLVLQLGQQLAELGIVSAIIQRPEISNRYRDTACVMAAFAGFLAAVLLFGCSQIIAERVFDLPELTPILQVMAITLAWRGVSLPSQALAQREFRFRQLAIVQLLSFGIGYLGVGVAMAISGMGVWSLVGAFVCQSVFEAGGLFAIRRVSFRFSFDGKSCHDILGFGGAITVATMANSLARQGEFFFIGRILGASSLGIYSRAQRLVNFPFGVFDRSAGRVLFPTLSRVADQPAKLRSAVRRTLSTGSLLMLPTSLVAAVTAKEIVSVALGDQWGQAIQPFQWMCLALYFRFVYKLAATVLRSTGQAKTFAVLQVSYACLALGIAWAFVQHGLVVVAIGASVAIIFLALVSFGITLNRTGLRMVEVGRCLVPTFMISAISLVISFAVAFTCRAASTNDFLTLMLTSLTTTLGVAAAVQLSNQVLLGEDGRWFLQLMRETLDQVTTKWRRHANPSNEAT